MDNEQRCRTCRWWKQCDQYPTWGYCAWADETYPEWLIETDMFPSNCMHCDDGKDCPTWHAKQ